MYNMLGRSFIILAGRVPVSRIMARNSFFLVCTNDFDRCGMMYPKSGYFAHNEEGENSR